MGGYIVCFDDGEWEDVEATTTPDALRAAIARRVAYGTNVTEDNVTYVFGKTSQLNWR